LEEAVRMMQLPAGNRRIYVGCEAAAMRRIRKHLPHVRGLDSATIVTQGYWKQGAMTICSQHASDMLISRASGPGIAGIYT
jgi:NADPH-dependent ferric siderophore reductase